MTPMRTNLRARLVVAFVCFVGSAAAGLQAQQSAAAPGTPAAVSRDLACAPAVPLVRTGGSIRVLGGREIRRTMFSTGEAVIIAGGTAQGVRDGEEYFVRRIVEDRYAEPVNGKFPATIHTAGVLKIVEAQAGSAIAVVTYACDGVMEGDYVERFAPAVLAQASIGTAPDFSTPGRLVLGTERRHIGGAGEFMVLNRGSDHGLRAGQRLTIFRDTVGGSGPVSTIGTATVHLVAAETSTIRIDGSVDAVYVGDMVAIHR
jgi:hypothetical protein